MEVSLIKESKKVGAMAWKPVILSVLVLASFVFSGCELYEEEEVIHATHYTNKSSTSKSSVVSANNIVASVQGSGGLVLTGSCCYARIIVEGSGSFIGSNLEIRDAEVIIRGSGHIYVWATDCLSVKIQGSGNVYYKGDPQIKSIIQGSGKLIKL